MTDKTFRQPKPLLGIGSLIGESFSIFFGRFLLIATIAFVPSLLDYIIAGLLVGYDVAINLKEPDLTNAGKTTAYVLSFFLGFAVNSFTAVLLVQLAYDTKLRQPVRLNLYFERVPRVILPLVVLSIATSVLTMGILLANIAGHSLSNTLIWLLFVPQFCLTTFLFVMAPAIVIEHAGIGSLKRSIALTKDYRWSIVGLLILVYIFILSINFIAAPFIGNVVAPGGIISGIILNSAHSAIISSLYSILVTLTYARLREIKDGVSVDQIVSVFD